MLSPQQVTQRIILYAWVLPAPPLPTPHLPRGTPNFGLGANSNPKLLILASSEVSLRARATNNNAKTEF